MAIFITYILCLIVLTAFCGVVVGILDRKSNKKNRKRP